MEAVFAKFKDVAQRPNDAIRAWKAAHNRKAVGTFPMHFPAEVIHAAGALPVVIQETDDPITSGHAGMYPFFCGYTRSVVDQASTGDLNHIDAIFFGDHCVQMLSAADIVRNRMPDIQVGFYQLVPALRDKWSFESAERSLRMMVEGIEEDLEVSIDEDSLRASIRSFNENRRLIRELYDLRRAGTVRVSSAEMQHVVKSSMVMDKEEHNALLRDLLAAARNGDLGDRAAGVPVYLSGHMCHAPKPAILDMIEECGATVVDDDLYTGFRYVSLDADETGDPIKALAHWYLNRNEAAPCPTRLDPAIDWDGWLLKKAAIAGAKGLIVLMPKYCEPHYFYYPRIKKTFETADVPHMLLETEHEMNVGGNIRTRIESFVELLKQRNRVAPVAA